MIFFMAPPMRTKVIKNQRGTTLIEFLFVFITLTSFISFFGVVLGQGWSKYWSSQSLKEGLFCLAETHSHFKCRQKTKNWFVSSVPFAQVESVLLFYYNAPRTHKKKYRGWISYRFNNQVFTSRESIWVP